MAQGLGHVVESTPSLVEKESKLFMLIGCCTESVVGHKRDGIGKWV